MIQLLSSALCVLLLSAAVFAQHHQHDQKGLLDAEPTAAAKYFSDVELIDQDGRKVRFYSDVLKGKTVVINALFTTCTNVCPPISRNLERIQEALGDRLGKDVFLVSITVDPVTDTPERLKEYAQKFHARPGWSFLTGRRRTSIRRCTNWASTCRTRTRTRPSSSSATKRADYGRKPSASRALRI